MMEVSMQLCKLRYLFCGCIVKTVPATSLISNRKKKVKVPIAVAVVSLYSTKLYHITLNSFKL